MPALISLSKEEMAERLVAMIREQDEHIKWLRGKVGEAVDFICESSSAADMDEEMLHLRDCLSELQVQSLLRSEKK